MTTTTYDPTSTAASLAKAYTDAAQTLLTSQTAAATQTASALTKLQSALSAFDSALTAMSGNKSVLSHSASFSDSSVATASASSSAVAGSYSFFVEQLATAGQMAYANLGTVSTPSNGALVVNLAGGTSFNVDLNAADLDGDGSLTPTEVATAINKASGNDGSVTASLITVGVQSQMVLSSTATGADSAISLDTSGLDASALKTALDGGTTLVAAQDAIVWLGAQNTGIELQQASNTYTAVAGVSMTFNKAMAAGTSPVTLTVGTDSSKTVANVQSFVDAYNTLEGVLDGLTGSGNASNGVAAGIFSGDSGVASLRSRIQASIRQSVGGLTLANYGITGNRDGTLSLDGTRLNAKLATDPDGLDALFGTTSLTAPSGVLGALDTTMTIWTSAGNGQIKQRQSSVTTLQASLTDRQTTLDGQYNSAYTRYLAQFTQLQNLQTQMAQTTAMFDALFSSSSSS